MFNTGAETLKGRTLRRDPRCVDVRRRRAGAVLVRRSCGAPRADRRPRPGPASGPRSSAVATWARRPSRGLRRAHTVCPVSSCVGYRPGTSSPRRTWRTCRPAGPGTDVRRARAAPRAGTSSPSDSGRPRAPSMEQPSWIRTSSTAGRVRVGPRRVRGRSPPGARARHLTTTSGDH